MKVIDEGGGKKRQGDCTQSKHPVLLYHFSFSYNHLDITNLHQVMEMILFVNNAAINFCHNHPSSRSPPGICIENMPPLRGFCILIFALDGGDLLG